MPRAKREGAAKGRGHKALNRKSDMKGGLLSWPAARKLAERLRAQTLERAPRKCERSRRSFVHRRWAFRKRWPALRLSLYRQFRQRTDVWAIMTARTMVR